MAWIPIKKNVTYYLEAHNSSWYLTSYCNFKILVLLNSVLLHTVISIVNIVITVVSICYGHIWIRLIASTALMGKLTFFEVSFYSLLRLFTGLFCRRFTVIGICFNSLLFIFAPGICFEIPCYSILYFNETRNLSIGRLLRDLGARNFRTDCKKDL